MTALLTAAALAMLLWPDRQARSRVRVRELGAARSTGRRVRSAQLPVPGAAAGISAAVAAVLSTPLVAALAAGATFLAARSWTAGRREHHAEQRLLSLTEGLGALAGDLRSGRSLDAATVAAVDACADAGTGAALARTLRAPEAAPPPGQDAELAGALARVSAGVLLSARTGCSLAAVAAAVEDDLRARHRLRLELRTATAGPRASAVLLACLPLLGIVMGHGVGADPWRVLTTTATGQVLLVVGVVLELAGLAWSGRLVRRALR
ncbi:type II secretion system F family protein [Blastococcus deserti]|uniref:Type II secretion system F family protein n=1 Tax=Blastococcus deserti TaxID=2259033 RepID=A0ABW4X977_9ACTN